MFFVLVLVLIAFALVAGFASGDIGRLNWEW
jgi:hypothetical protein